MLKRFTAVAVSLLFLLSCQLQPVCAQTGGGEDYDTRLLAFYQTIMDETFKFFGLDELGATVTVIPEALTLYPTFDDFYDSLKKTVEYMLPMLEKERLNAEPDYNPAVVVFPENADISVFIDNKPLDFGEFKPYAIRIRNHDEVMFPAEGLLEALGLEYEWEPEEGVLSVTTNGFYEGANPIIHTLGMDYYAVDGTEFPDFDQCFDIIDGCPYISFGIIRTAAVVLYYPVIYHDLGKVVFVTREMLSNSRTKALAEMGRQFERADYPLTDVITVMINDAEVLYKDAQPFVIKTALDDFIMLPLLETLEYMGIMYTWDDDANEAVIQTENGEYTVREGQPLMQSDGTSLSGEVGTPPVVIDGVMFVNHTYVSMHYSGLATCLIYYPQSTLFIRNLNVYS